MVRDPLIAFGLDLVVLFDVCGSFPVSSGLPKLFSNNGLLYHAINKIDFGLCVCIHE